MSLNRTDITDANVASARRATEHLAHAWDAVREIERDLSERLGRDIDLSMTDFDELASCLGSPPNGSELSAESIREAILDAEE